MLLMRNPRNVPGRNRRPDLLPVHTRALSELEQQKLLRRCFLPHPQAIHQVLRVLHEAEGF